MGKTPVAMDIWVALEWVDHPAIKALRDKGHAIHGLSTPPDIILHPAAHYWCEQLWSKPQYLEAALKRARAKRKAVK